MMDAMLGTPGIIGARQAGAGFGGCMVALAEADSVEAFTQHVHKAYAQSAGIVPQVYPVEAAGGAQLIESRTLE
jgi:galactokinase